MTLFLNIIIKIQIDNNNIRATAWRKHKTYYYAEGRAKQRN